MKTRVKLSKITRLSLEKKGRKDAKRKVICFDNCDNGFLSTPFVREEISVCLSNIHREQEKMLHKNIRYLRSNDIRSSKKAQYQSKLDGLKREWIVKENYAENLEQNKNTLEKTGPNEVSLPGEDQLPNKDNTIKEFRKIEWQAPIEVEKAKIKKYKDRLNKWLTRQSSRIRFLETKINKIESRENRKRIREGLRNKIFIERCKQYYSLAIIRISAYWTGVLNFSSNEKLKSCISGDHIITNEELQMVVDKLSDSLEIPELKDVSIYWYGLGLVGGEQPELNKKSKNNLKNIWEKIIEQSGATVKFIDVNMLPEDLVNERETLPLVSVVLFDESVKLDVDALGFEPNSCEFRAGTEEQRRRILKKYTNEAFYNNILLVGTTSSDGYQGARSGFELSLDRANAVKDELIKLGVPAENIQTKGLGTTSHKYDTREFINGHYDGNCEAAKNNRSVYIMLANSRAAKDFLDDEENLRMDNT